MSLTTPTAATPATIPATSSLGNSGSFSS
jgi:hypothetical protein